MCCFVQELFSSRIVYRIFQTKHSLEAILDEVFKPGATRIGLPRGSQLRKQGTSYDAHVERRGRTLHLVLGLWQRQWRPAEPFHR